MQQYGRNIVWGTAGVGNILKGICENFSETKAVEETDELDGVGDFAAHILYNERAELSWTSKLLGGGQIPIIGGESGCLITVDGYTNVLLQSVTETGGNNQPRKLQLSATSYPDLLAPIGGASAELRAVAIPASAGAMIFPKGYVFFGTPDVKLSWGMIQSYQLTQQVKHNPQSEDGKIRLVVVNGYEITCELEVLMFSDQAIPKIGDPLVLDTAPTLFQKNNYIKSARKTATLNEGAIYAVTSRWTPVLDKAA